MQSAVPDDSDSNGSSAGTDDQSGTPPQPTHNGMDQSEITTHLSGKLQNVSLNSRWSDLEMSDTSSVDSLVNGNSHERSLTEADDKQKARENYEKTLIKRAHISNEYLRLSDLLRSNSSKKIVGILEEKLHKKDSKTIVALSVLLPRSEFPPTGSLHCARCHKNFNPKNGSQCMIRHPNSAVTKISQDANGTGFRCRACNTDFRLSMMNFYNEHVNSYLAGCCYSGSHTENPCQVAYEGAVRTCEENGCVEFYV